MYEDEGMADPDEGYHSPECKHCHERLISHNGQERVVAIVEQLCGVIEGRIRVGDRREDSQSLIADCPH